MVKVHYLCAVLLSLGNAALAQQYNQQQQMQQNNFNLANFHCYSGVGYARVLTTCSLNERVCKKFDNWVTPPTYLCSSDIVTYMGCHNSQVNGVYGKLCYCNSDSCNGARSVLQKRDVVVLAAATLVSLVMAKWMY